MESSGQEPCLVRNIVSRFRSFRLGSSSDPARYDGFRVVAEISEDSSSQKLVPAKPSEDSLAMRSKQLAVRSIQKGKEVLRDSEMEYLEERLRNLEEENEVMKQTLVEAMEERNKMVKEVYEQFKALLQKEKHNPVADFLELGDSFETT